MQSSVEAPPEVQVPFRRLERTIQEQGVGALVVGGEHPGLGIARSLGRRGIPVYVVDDQHSVSSFSRYVHRVIHTDDLLDERKTVEAVLEIGHSYGLKGWVLFPTRDETVAAFSRYRRELESFFRLTTPDWKVVQVGVGQEKYLQSRIATENSISSNLESACVLLTSVPCMTSCRWQSSLLLRKNFFIRQERRLGGQILPSSFIVCLRRQLG